MLSFLNASVLFAAAAALIPLIIHLFSRRRVKIVEFSSLRHLKSMQRQQVRRLKIRQLLLLLLRMLTILAVVLAFARPTTKTGPVGAHAAVSAVVLLDNSASMNRSVADGNLFEIAKTRTRELLQTFGQSDQVLLIAASGDDEGAIDFSTSAVALERLETIIAGTGQADLETALDRAAKLMSDASNLNREIYIISDRQRNSMPANKSLDQVDAGVYLVDLPLEDQENCGVIEVDFGGQLIQPGHEFELTASVRNYGAERAGEKIASLFLNGSRVAQTGFNVAAGSETSVRFARSISRTGFHSGYVEISDDKLLSDNRYYFSFRVPERFNLLIVADEGTAQYLSLALVPDLSLSQYWSVKEATPADLAGVNFVDYDVVMLAGAPELSQSHSNRLKAFVRRGKALFVSYGSQTDIDYFNNVWSELTGVVFDAPIIRNAARTGYYTLQSIEPEHPVFSVFGYRQGNREELPEIKFFTLPGLHIEGTARTLMQFTGNRPALTESRYGDGKVMCFTGPMSLEYTDLPGHAFFVPFVSRIAEYLASDLSTLDLRLYAGEDITRSLSLTGSISYPVQLRMPDSSRYSLPPEEDKGALVIRVAPSDQLGQYRVSYLGREIDRFAVNLTPGEGDLSRSDPELFAQALGADQFRLLETGHSLEESIAGFRFGRELWQVFMWLAVLFVILEMLLARGFARDRNQPDE